MSSYKIIISDVRKKFVFNGVSSIYQLIEKDKKAFLDASNKNYSDNVKIYRRLQILERVVAGEAKEINHI